MGDSPAVLNNLYDAARRRGVIATHLQRRALRLLERADDSTVLESRIEPRRL
jgi:hypothetical protein